MVDIRSVACLIFGLMCLAWAVGPAHAVVDSQHLGARYDPASSDIVFRVYSSRATRIELQLYADAYGTPALATYVLSKDAANVWSASVSMSDLRVAGSDGPIFYGYRAWGPNWPYVPNWSPGSSAGFVVDVDASGNRFNPNKLLLDPYALELSHDPINAHNNDGTVFATGENYRVLDSGPKAPKGIVLRAEHSFGTKPTRAQKDDIVYEVHLRGLTENDPDIPAEARGTYRGAALKAGYLAALGVTAVEFLPVQETQNDANDLTPDSAAGDNYWGYATLAYFAPDRRYASDRSPGGPTREFKSMVKAFHDAGIKVLIDVVYNHTGEGGAWNAADKTTYNLLSFRGLDNPTYYSLTEDMQFSFDNTGVGGNFNTHNTVAQNLIVDSLVYWRDVMGVDGFRFDLAAVLGNTCDHGCFRFDKLDPSTALNRIVRELKPRPEGGGAGVDLIAEPWAIGEDTYQVGGFPAGWSEWNGKYRDDLRKAQNKLGEQDVSIATLATRFAGSSDLYQNNGRSPWNSVNFIDAHDGLTLRDLYSCDGKNNNQTWPYGPSDGGTDDDNSWDQGGAAADQRRAARTGLALLLLSAGTPMISGGDEHLRSLNCNNNPYNLDSFANWLSFSLTAEQANFATFTTRMIAFRKTHPALRPQIWYSARDNDGNGMVQLQWYTPAGTVADPGYWANAENHSIAWEIDGAEFGDPASAIYVGFNGWSDEVSFVLPPAGGKNWYRVTDTCNWAEGPENVALPGSETWIGSEGASYALCGRGLLLLLAK
ncbi:MAG: glycogen-debranching protein [Xanthobacteraceae bacterium]|nr:glycogen-debranching protein [Xanthobacteraceae bacterium]